jgi:N-acetylmuramoyl-L-alanine amidase
MWGLGLLRPVRGAAALAGVVGVLALAFAAAFLAGSRTSGATKADDIHRAALGEARQAHVTVPVAAAVAGLRVSEAKAPGRPIVLIDPGHGGHDPGAPSVSGTVTEKDLALLLARELRDRLVERGRVRVAMTRETDTYLSLEQRAQLARQLNAALFLSLHIDSAPNPLARGASIYSLSDVASDAETARFASRENGSSGASGADSSGPVGAILADLALREQMEASAELASRLVRKSAGRVALRPEPHRFAAFHVLRSTGTASVLFEAGYISNADDELLLQSPEHRKRVVTALAEAIETDVASRRSR